MVQTVIDTHFKKAVSPNLTSNFTGYWEIDGNLGITSAIGEMLMQSHTGEIVLLPALPAKYPDGEVKGLRARNGIEVNIKWKNNKLVEALIVSDFGGGVELRYGDNTIGLELSKGEEKRIKYEDFQKKN